MLVNRFKFYEGVINLGSYSRKYHKEATGSRKVPTEVKVKLTNAGSYQLVAGNTNSRRYQQKENQQQVRGKKKSHLKEGNIVHVAAPNHGVSGLLVGLRGHRR
jgi:hypothetical protein